MGDFDASVFQFEDSGLVAGQAYYYTIVATNGDDGDPVTISAQPAVVPDKPDPALLVAGGDGTLNFTFTPATGAAAGQSTIVRFTLYRNDGLGGVLRFSYDVDSDGASTESLGVGGLVEGRSYLFQTSYWNRVGQSELSDVVSIQCCDFSVPGSGPTNLRREGDQSDTKITVAWDSVTDIGSSTLIYYTVYADDGTTEVSKNTADADTLSEFFEGLDGGRPYRFAVAAVNAAGEGPRSDRLTLICSDVAGPPQSVRATASSTSSITLEWERPLSGGLGGLSGYKVYVDDGYGGDIDNLIWDGSTRSSTLYFTWAPTYTDGTTALLPGNAYSFIVQSVNPTGDGGQSSVFSTVAASKPLAPGRPEPDTAATTSASITLAWTAPDDGGSPILGYIVERTTDPFSGSWLQLTTRDSPHTDTTLTDTTDIAVDQRYTYRVSAFNLVDIGDTIYSPEAYIYAASAPVAPTLTFVTSTETTITVSWNAPTSDLPITGYQVYVDTLLQYDGTGIPTTQTFTLAGCSTGSLYYFKVVAVSLAGESAESTSLARTCARRPYPMAQPYLKSSTQVYIEIAWEPPSDNGGMPITGYKVQSANYDTYIFTSVQCLKEPGRRVLHCAIRRDPRLLGRQGLPVHRWQVQIPRAGHQRHRGRQLRGCVSLYRG
ncbi:unnamed protein product [Prorocentrum cordatum]|uniref:Fibronectin type-III domain-containing protein n=1 Tax=Prorocentrum cordatum TaxID=2364126 RepID=A0ABN9TCK2_9DINO|nr:unnamed protein product [Polarella glacialis]